MEGTRAMWVVKAVRVPIYDHLHLEIILSNDTSRVAKYANIPAEEVGIYSGLVFKREARRRSSVCIYLYTDGSDLPTFNTIAHEVFHAANYIFESIGAKPDTQNDEPQAYLVGWIAGEVHKALKKKTFNSL